MKSSIFRLGAFVLALILTIGLCACSISEITNENKEEEDEPETFVYKIADQSNGQLEYVTNQLKVTGKRFVITTVSVDTILGLKATLSETGRGKIESSGEDNIFTVEKYTVQLKFESDADREEFIANMDESLDSGFMSSERYDFMLACISDKGKTVKSEELGDVTELGFPMPVEFTFTLNDKTAYATSCKRADGQTAYYDYYENGKVKSERIEMPDGSSYKTAYNENGDPVTEDPYSGDDDSGYDDPGYDDPGEDGEPASITGTWTAEGVPIKMLSDYSSDSDIGKELAQIYVKLIFTVNEDGSCSFDYDSDSKKRVSDILYNATMKALAEDAARTGKSADDIAKMYGYKSAKALAQDFAGFSEIFTYKGYCTVEGDALYIWYDGYGADHVTSDHFTIDLKGKTLTLTDYSGEAKCPLNNASFPITLKRR